MHSGELTSKKETAACRYAFILLVLGILLFVFKITMSSVLKSGRFTKVRLDVLECYNGSETFDPTVILVSLDGFRPDYLERNRTPHLLNLGKHCILKQKWLEVRDRADLLFLFLSTTWCSS